MAKNLVYLYGPVACRRERMEEAANKHLGIYSHLRALTDCRSGRDPSFAELFRAFACLGCALHHDRVFGLLGIANRGQNSVNFRVDYGMSRGALFKKTILLISDSERSDFVQNFVYTVRLTLEDVDVEPAGTWDDLLGEPLAAEIVCSQISLTWGLRVT